MRRLKVGVVGAGEVASKVHLPVLATMSQELEVVWVADISKESAQRTALGYRCRAVHLKSEDCSLPESDIALITVPVGARAGYYSEFAQRGTAVLAEKPVVINVTALDALREVFSDERFAVNFQRRTYASSQVLRDIVRSGILGKLLSVHAEEGARMTRTGVPLRFHDDVSLSGGGILMDLGCHATDLTFWLTGARATTDLHVSGQMDKQIDREVTLHAQLHLPDGGEVMYDASFSWLTRRRGVLECCFSNGTAVVSSGPSSEIELQTSDGHAFAFVSKSAANQRGSSTVHQACYLVWRSFLDALALRARAQFTLDSVRPTIVAIQSAYEKLLADG